MTQVDQREFRDGVPFLGGRLWIDLLNTTPAGLGPAVDFLASAEAQQHWARLAGVAVTAAAQPARLLALRASLREAFEAMAQRLPLPQQTLDSVNALLGQLRIALTLEMQAGEPQLMQREAAARDQIAVAVALDFARFASGFEADRLRHCANPACNMVFHDHGKNNRRRWCSMAVCGNRDKVASFRARRARQD